MKPAPDSMVAGKYRLRRPLARGGMGSVWIAEHVELGIDVALKFLRTDEVDPRATERFRKEAKAAARLRSPHIVQVLDFGVEDDTPYLAMELLVGEDLALLLDRRGALPKEEALAIVEQAASGLGVAHGAGVVHRDVKPANLFVLADSGAVKVLDFGIAKTAWESDAPGARDDKSHTTAGVVWGSPGYMSPEQARGGQVDRRSDLFSLAAVAYRALTGREPFEGTTSHDVVVRLCTESAPQPSSIAPELPRALDGFFDRALARDPDARFPDVDTFTRALRSAILGVVPSGEEPTGPESGHGESRRVIAAAPRVGSNPGRSSETLPLRAAIAAEPSELATTETRDALQGSGGQPKTRRGLLLLGLATTAVAGLGTWLLRGEPEEDGPRETSPTVEAPSNDAIPAPEQPKAPPPPAEALDEEESPPTAVPTAPAPAHSSANKPPPRPRAVPPPSRSTDPLFGLPVEEPRK